MRQFPKHLQDLFTKRSVKSITLASICLLLAILACTQVTPTPDAAQQQTQVAQSVAETMLAGGLQPPATTEAPPAPPTPTESPWIEGSVERASYDPAAGLGTPDVHDDFSGTNPEFELNNSYGVAHGWYYNGRYNITFPTRGWWTWYSGASSAMNFYIDIVVYNANNCADRDAGGLLYRYYQTADYGLLFGVTCGGGYFSGISGGMGATGPVCQFISNAPVGPGDINCNTNWVHPTSQYIDPGPGAANRIGVRAVGQNITLYINGHQVDSLLLPASFSYTGEFALYLGAGQADNSSVSFDDLSIWFNP